jgi:hypothetical protein
MVRAANTWSEEQRKASGTGKLTSFFVKKKKPGRPRKRSSKAGQPAKLKDPPPPAAAKQAAAPPKPPPRVQINWSVGENAIKLEKAVTDWFDKAPSTYHNMSEKPLSIRSYAELVGIPNATLRKYVCADESKRQALGVSRGKPSIVDPVASKFVADTIRRADRGNNGLSRREAIDLVLEARRVSILSRRVIFGAER